MVLLRPKKVFSLDLTALTYIDLVFLRCRCLGASGLVFAFTFALSDVAYVAGESSGIGNGVAVDVDVAVEVEVGMGICS